MQRPGDFAAIVRALQIPSGLWSVSFDLTVHLASEHDTICSHSREPQHHSDHEKKKSFSFRSCLRLSRPEHSVSTMSTSRLSCRQNVDYSNVCQLLICGLLMTLRVYVWLSASTAQHLPITVRHVENYRHIYSSIQVILSIICSPACSPVHDQFTDIPVAKLTFQLFPLQPNFYLLEQRRIVVISRFCMKHLDSGKGMGPFRPTHFLFKVLPPCALLRIQR